MGWSIDVIRASLTAVFNALDRRYKLDHPDAFTPRVFINYEGDPISVTTMKRIVSLFPDTVYVGFFSNQSFKGQPYDNQDYFGETETQPNQ